MTAGMLSYLSRLLLQLLEEFNTVIMNLLQINAWMIVRGEPRLQTMTSSLHTLKTDL